MLKLHTNTGGLVWCILTLACISFISPWGPHCVSRCTAKSDKGTLQLSVSCINRCGTETPVWVKVLQSIPSLSSGQAQLPSNCQPLSLAHCLLPTQQPYEHLCEHSSSFTAACFQAFFLSLLLSHSPHLPPGLPCGDICCCLHGTLALSHTSPPSSWPPPWF